MKRRIRWELIGYDTFIYLACALFIFLVYPSSIYVLTVKQIILFTLAGWVCVMGFRMLFHLYLKIWRYAGPVEYITLISSDAIATVVYLLAREFVPNSITFVRAATLMMMNLLGCVMLRMIYLWVYQRRARGTKFEKWCLKALGAVTGTYFPNEAVNPNRIRVAIIGAGTIGAMLADELLRNPRASYQPVCFVDANEGKVGREVYGIPVLDSKKDLQENLRRHHVQEVIFAMPNATQERRQELYEAYKSLGYRIKAYDFPTFGEDGKRVLHDLNIDDLLFRSPAEFLSDETKAYYRDKSIMITGGGGSIGSELARQIARCNPGRLVLLDVYENGVYEIQQELVRKHPGMDIRVEIVSICDKPMLEKAFSEHAPQIILHAAAHKHVPLMERNACEAIRNNVFGTLNVIDTCEKFGTDRFIMISTDKAVNPTNVMGATKRMCEMLVLSRPNSKTKYSAVRFGNVLGSNGSVIPLFEKQIAAGGPVTITDKRIIRYFMTIPEATQLVMTTGAMARSGELYVLDMGKPVKILTLAENMIRLSGLEPYRDIEIKEIGLRPGEKLYEELLIQGETLGRTENEKIYIEEDRPLTQEEIREKLAILEEALQTRSNKKAREALKQVVPTFHAPEEVNKAVADESEEKDE